MIYSVQEAAINMWINAGLPGNKLVVGITVSDYPFGVKLY
jgi:hypothetical protein